MTVTLTVVGGWLALSVLAVVVHHRWREAQRRRDRELVRRITRYLDGLPPARPW